MFKFGRGDSPEQADTYMELPGKAVHNGPHSAVAFVTSAEFAKELMQLEVKDDMDEQKRQILAQLTALRGDYTETCPDIQHHPEQTKALITQNGGENTYFILVAATHIDDATPKKAATAVLESMRHFAVRQGITEIAMSESEWSRTRLSGTELRKCLQRVFGGSGIQVRLFTGIQEEQEQDLPANEGPEV